MPKTLTRQRQVEFGMAKAAARLAAFDVTDTAAPIMVMPRLVGAGALGRTHRMYQLLDATQPVITRASLDGTKGSEIGVGAGDAKAKGKGR
jgi:hypothetical protein